MGGLERGRTGTREPLVILTWAGEPLDKLRKETIYSDQIITYQTTVYVYCLNVPFK